jgi:hypothetical protein
MIHVVVVLLLALLPQAASAQTGRIFVSAEAFAAAGRIIKLGKIVELKPIDYDKPLTMLQKIGKPYRLVFEVTENFRGDEGKRLELVLALQTPWQMEYMRDHKLEVLLLGGTLLHDYPHVGGIGIEEAGKPVNDEERYQFRLLDPVKIPEAKDAASEEQAEYARMLNSGFDECRMFNGDLKVITGSKEILPVMRAFVKKHPQVLLRVMVDVPNEFGAQVGSSNAYCGISLPICPETKATLVALKADPGLILDRVKEDPELILKRIKESNEAYKKYYRPILTESLDKALAEFPEVRGK